MNGARKYANLFKTGQYGKLYITSGSHARGKTFNIQLLPDGVDAKSNGSMNLCVNNDVVEVYGIIGGQPGWTESYGWIHEGKWCDDFYALVEDAEKNQDERKAKNLKIIKDREAQKKHKEQELLSNY